MDVCATTSRELSKSVDRPFSRCLFYGLTESFDDLRSRGLRRLATRFKLLGKKKNARAAGKQVILHSFEPASAARRGLREPTGNQVVRPHGCGIAGAWCAVVHRSHRHSLGCGWRGSVDQRHRFIRLRWGFLDEVLSVDWAVPGDANDYDTIRECLAAGQPVDLVTGSAPGWTDPWSRAQRVTIVSSDAWFIVVESEGEQWQVSRMEIQAVRVAADPPSP